MFRALKALFAAAVVVTVLQMASPASAATASAIDQRYAAEPELRQLLGGPTGAEFAVAGGRQRNYKWGSLYWTSSTGVHEVHGAIWSKYKALGGPGGPLGFPVTDEVESTWRVPTNVVMAHNAFQQGALMWNLTAVIRVAPTYFAKWESWISNGAPKGNEISLGNGKYKMVFDFGTFYRSATTGTHYVGTWIHGDPALREKYYSLGGEKSFLGLPKSDRITLIEDVDDGFQSSGYQKFEWGNIYHKERSVSDVGAHEVHGAILSRFQQEGGVAKLGFPVTDEQAAPGGRISRFEHGSISWSSATGKTTVVYG